MGEWCEGLALGCGLRCKGGYLAAMGEWCELGSGVGVWLGCEKVVSDA